MADISVMTPGEGFNTLLRARHGTFLYNRNDTYVGRSLQLYGEYCESESRIFTQLCQPNDSVVEIGANIGAHTVPMAKAVGVGGMVYAFEPQRVVFQTLCANAALNSLTNVECHWAAVGRESGEVLIPDINYDKSSNFGGVAVDGFSEGRKVPLVALDSHLDLPHLRLLKIDVEGMEAQVLEGAKETIATHRPYIYLENDRVEKSEALIRQVMGMEYRLYWHLPTLFSPDNFFGSEDNVFENIIAVNMFCIPSELSPELEGFHEVSDPSEHPMRRSLEETT